MGLILLVLPVSSVFIMKMEFYIWILSKVEHEKCTIIEKADIAMIKMLPAVVDL